jgi:hypothetical protein
MELLGLRSISGCTNSHPHLLIVTDGVEDMCRSKRFSKDSIQRILEKPASFATEALEMPGGKAFSNFHATCISVGTRAATNFDWARTTGVKHVCTSDASEVRGGFEEVKSCIEKSRKKITTEIDHISMTFRLESSTTMIAATSGMGGLIAKSRSTPPEDSPRELCPYYRRPEGCKFGNTCRNRHV